MKNKNIKKIYWLSVVIGIFTVILVCFLIVRNYFYRDLIYSALPKEATIAAVEWNSDHTTNELKAVSKLIDFPTAVQIVNSDIKFLPQSVPQNTITKLRALSPFIKAKAIVLTKVDNKIYPVFIYRLKDNFLHTKYPENFTDLKGLAYIKNKDLFYFSYNKQAISNLLNNSKPVKSTIKYQEAVANIPRFNIADFYLNHDLLQSIDLQGYLGLFQDFNQKLGVTVGALNTDNKQLYFSTFTNESSKYTNGFPVTRNKYKANLIKYIAADTQVFFSGVNVSDRLNKLFKSPDFAAQVLNVLNSYNLSPDALKLLIKVLNDEFAITLDKVGNLSFITSDLSAKDSKILSSELSRLASFFNPIIEPYKLGDGTLANVLVPSSDYKPVLKANNTLNYNLKTLNKNLYLSQIDSYGSELTVLTTNNLWQLNTNSIFDFDHIQNMLASLLPIADEVLYLDSKFLYQFFQHNFDKQDVPNVMTSSNFFNDGIQTVTILNW